MDPLLTTGPWTFINKLLDLPRTAMRHWRTAVGYALAIGSALIPSLAYWLSAEGVYAKLSLIKACYEDAGGSGDCAVGASSWGTRTLLWPALASIGMKLSGLMLSTAKRLGGLNVSQVLTRGEECFILYLRAFDADDVIPPTPRLPLLSNLVSLRPFPARVEDELFDVADGYRPLVAVDKPGTRRVRPAAELIVPISTTREGSLTCLTRYDARSASSSC